MDKIDMRNRPVIFYGAGHEARFEIKKFAARGVTPVCFCDRNPQKWEKPFLGVECMPLEKALEKYPDFLMVVTPQIPLRFRIMEDLLARKLVTKERLLNYEPYIKMKSCISLHSILDASAFKVLAICCGQVEHSRRPQLPFSGNLTESIAKIKQYRQELLEGLNSPESTEHSVCGNCRWAVEDYWPVDTRIRTVKYDFGGVCQFNCLYCFSPARHRNKEEEWAKKARLPEFLDALEQADLLHPDAIIEYAAGEICVAPNQDEIFNVLKRYTSTIITNAGVYSPGLAKLIRDGKVRELLVSLDAGTPQTFRIMKGNAGVFENVKENLAKYISMGAQVDLKYIFMDGINDNTEDVDGFVAVAKELGVSRIFIAKDHRKGVVAVSEDLLTMMKRMVKSAHRNGLETVLASGFFTKCEIAQLS